MKRLLMLSLLLILLLPAAAQEEDYFAYYDDIEQSRTEDGGFVLGDPDAPVTIVEFADFMCPHCQNYRATVHEFIDTYVRTGQARFEYRFYPVVHPTYSVFTAQIAECAEVQRDGAFWAAHDLLYDIASDGQIGPNTPETVAETLGLDIEKLDVCRQTAAQHEIDGALGEALGVSGTPATLVRLADGTLGWPFLREQVFNRGGLPLPLLTTIVEAEVHANIVVVPRPLLEDLVTEPACAPACWRGVVPGETIFDDVIDLIRDDRQNVEINVEELEDGTRAVSWRTFDSSLNNPNYILGGADGTVEMISLLDVSTFSIGDVVGVYGEPDYALAVPASEASALFYALYADEALIVLSLVLAEEGLTESSQLVGAQYFTPAVLEELLSGREFAEWTGYDGWDSYLSE